MAIQKPLPLMVGNKPYYSLTSYDPVQITVDVPRTTDEEVDHVLDLTLRQFGATRANLDDPQWVAQNFEGLTTRAQVHEAVRRQVEAMNTDLSDEQKLAACLEALRERLAQAVPPQILNEARRATQAQFTQMLQAEGMTPQQYLQLTGTTTLQLEAMFDEQAHRMAETNAALSAYAHQKKLQVSEQEMGELLGIPAENLQQVLSQARAAGQLDDLREAALVRMAMLDVVAECSCTYRQETPEQARARVAEMRKAQALFEHEVADAEQEPGEEPPASGRTGFKLV